MSHPRHPACPDCQKALFKRPDSGKVHKDQPYKYCSNPDCKSFSGVYRNPAVNAVKGIPVAQARVIPAWQTDDRLDRVIETKPLRAKPASGPAKASGPKTKPKKAEQAPAVTQPTGPEVAKKTGPKRRALPASEAPRRPQEPEPIQVARKRLRSIVATLTEGRPPSAVGLVLAILNQETGNHAAANALIDELELTKTFGIMKFDGKPPPG
jgi:hypothetical protein